MSDIAIKVENLSKSYLVGHNTGQGERYTALRDVIARNTKNLVRKTRDMFQGKAIIQGDEIEEFWALKDVSFEIKQGDRVGIIGRNGAGKSTLLKLLSRITEPTKGRIQINGRVASLLEVGTGFHPELTGRENIFLNGAILGMSRKEIQRKFDEIVDFAEVEQFLDTPVKRYSSGMYVRLAFAVAAHLEPEILVVDEVLAVGDAQFQKKCLGKMETSSNNGKTVLFVSHNMTALKSLCNRGIWLNSGNIVETGRANEIVANYLQNGTHLNHHQFWNDPASAPGNEKIKLHSVKVAHAGINQGEPLNVESEVNLEFEIWNYMNNAMLNFSVVLYDNEEICVFNSGSEPRRFPKGIVKGICRIPGNLLNDNIYRIRLLIVQDGSFAITDNYDLLAFEVQDVERNGGWFGKWAGAVRPRLQWDTFPP